MADTPAVGGGGGDGGGSSGLTQLLDVADFLVDFAKSPKDKVINWVTNRLGSLLVKGFVSVMSFVLYAVVTPFNIAADAWGTIADALVAGVGPAVDAILSAVSGINQSIASTAAAGGLAAPWIVWGLTVFEIVLVLWLVQQIVKLVNPQ